MPSALMLVKPSSAYMDSYFNACREFDDTGGHCYGGDFGESPVENFNKMIVELDEKSRGIGLPEGWVPSSTYWLVENGVYIGSGRIRYALTETLRVFGGHIGYDIRPSKRRQGYGTLQLKLLLAEAAKWGIKNALLTCDTDNTASRRVMEKNGGKLIDCVKNRIDGHDKPAYRYMIDTGLADGVLYNTGAQWYHGSGSMFEVLAAGSTITQDYQLAEAFSHKPSMLAYGDDKTIWHNGTASGIIYVIDEPAVPGEDMYLHPRTTMDAGLEWLTARPFKARRISWL